MESLYDAKFRILLINDTGFGVSNTLLPKIFCTSLVPFVAVPTSSHIDFGVEPLNCASDKNLFNCGLPFPVFPKIILLSSKIVDIH